MVSTRSTRSSSKHEVPKADNEAPAKKQKVSKAATDTKNGHEIAKPETEVLSKDVTISNDQEVDSKDSKTVENGKAENANAETHESMEVDTDTKNGGAKVEDQKSEYIAQLTSLNCSSSILEKGVFYFFFRPRVNTEDVTSITDVQKSYLLLRPTKSNIASVQESLRIIQIPKKVLPKTGTHERFLGFVISSDESLENLKDDIGETTYSTATRGERLQPAARPVGEGVYAITGDANGRTSHFAY